MFRMNFDPRQAKNGEEHYWLHPCVRMHHVCMRSPTICMRVQSSCIRIDVHKITWTHASACAHVHVVCVHIHAVYARILTLAVTILCSKCIVLLLFHIFLSQMILMFLFMSFTRFAALLEQGQCQPFVHMVLGLHDRDKGFSECGRLWATPSASF